MNELIVEIKKDGNTAVILSRAGGIDITTTVLVESVTEDAFILKIVSMRNPDSRGPF